MSKMQQTIKESIHFSGAGIHTGVLTNMTLKPAKENTVIAAQTGIAGSSKIGKDCMIGGQVAISGHLTIADEIKIAGQSGIASSITKKGAVVQGPMAFDIKEFQRSYILFRKLPEMYKTLNSIKAQFDA